MKITKSQLREIIKEEAASEKAPLDAIKELSKSNMSWDDPALISASKKLTTKIEDLDVSMDFLSAAVAGADPQSVGGAQAALSRGAAPRRNIKSELEEIIREELATVINEDKDHPGESCAEVHPGKKHEEWEKTLEEKENNPWAICTAQVGREDKEKYEKCVKSVKQQNRSKK